MRNNNHFFRGLFLTFAVTCFSQISSAQDLSSVLNSTSKVYIDCRSTFLKSSPQASEAEVDAFCKTKMSAQAFCIEQGFYNSIQVRAGQVSSAALLSEAPAIKSKVFDQCKSISSANASTPPPVAPPTNAMSGLNGEPLPPSKVDTSSCKGDQTCIQAANATYQENLKKFQENKQAWDKKQAEVAAAAAAQQQQQNAQSRMAGLQATQQMLPLMGQMAQVSDSKGNNPVNLPPGSFQTVRKVDPKTGVVTTVTTRTPDAKGVVTDGPVSQSGAASKMTNASTATPADGTGIDGLPTPKEWSSKIGPAKEAAGKGSEGLADNVQKAGQTTADQTPVEKTIISTEADARIKILDADIKAFDGIKATLTANNVKFSKTLETIEKLKTSYSSFVKSKVDCIKRAELTEKLCLESPGMKAAKAFVDYSGPALSIISSAQKACSSTKKVLDFAAMGMAAAKTICVGAKVVCDATCGSASSKIANIQKDIAAIGPNLKIDMDLSMTKGTFGEGPATKNCLHPDVVEFCKVEAINAGNNNQNLIQAIKKLQTDIKTEVSIEPGTTVDLVKSCENKGRDIAFMITGIGGVLMSKMSAEKCEKQLASTGGAGGAGNSAAMATTAEYCSQPGNSTTQFCKCQGSNLGSAACSGITDPKIIAGSSDGAAGTNIKTGAGMSNFAGAGGNSNGGTRSGVDFKILSNPGLADYSSSASNISGDSSLKGGVGSEGTSGVGAVGGSGGPNASGDSSGSVGKFFGVEDKKWEFGSFGSSSGGSASFGSSRGGTSGNGELSAQQQEYVERKLASERFSAEVTTSSGVDNFSKIKKSYSQKADTFMSNP